MGTATDRVRASRQLKPATSRLQSIDIVRGAVMIIMALDHVRDFMHRGAFDFSPEDLARTTAALFVTRWITHFCAPVFMLTAGLGAYFYGRTRSRRDLSRFLLTRGLWLVFLEFTVVRLGMMFNFDYSFSVPNVLWALGLCMIGLSVLIWLPVPALAILSCATILLHDLADGVSAASLGSFAWLWIILHQIGVIKIGSASIQVAYSFVPWFAVMAAGYCLGPFLRKEFLLRLGIALTAAFVVVRTTNVYGDPFPWRHTMLSFFRVTKYPPSLDFLLMTLGPALIAMGLLDRVRLPAKNPLLVFGRVPLFYFVVHLFVIHLAAVLIAYMRYGHAGFLLTPLPSMGGNRDLYPPDYGLTLPWVYAIWISVVALMYPLCRWFAGVKQRRNDWWLSYL